MEESVKSLISKILQFQQRNHPAWDAHAHFDERIRDLPLYFLVLNHPDRDTDIESVTITHYVPQRAEIMALAAIIKSCGRYLRVCDIGCGNGFLGSLLAREGVHVFGIDNRSYTQPQLSNFFDEHYYHIVEASLEDQNISFDVGFCSWMLPNTNLTPAIISKKPQLIIYVHSIDRQADESWTTGTPDAYDVPDEYRYLGGWCTFLPADYFYPLRCRYSLNVTANKQEINQVGIYMRAGCVARFFSPLAFSGCYDWDNERTLINQLRQELGMSQWTLQLIGSTS